MLSEEKIKEAKESCYTTKTKNSWLNSIYDYKDVDGIYDAIVKDGYCYSDYSKYGGLINPQLCSSCENLFFKEIEDYKRFTKFESQIESIDELLKEIGNQVKAIKNQNNDLLARIELLEEKVDILNKPNLPWYNKYDTKN